MGQSVESIIGEAIAREGGAKYTNNPADRGGPTKYGVTLETLRRYRRMDVSPADVAALTEEEARQIYRANYVIGPKFDQVLALSQPIGIELIDTGINMGTEVAATFLQRLLNVFNQRGTWWADIKVDGAIGNVSLNAIRSYLSRRPADGVVVMVQALNHLQGARYVDLAEKREANEDFVFGWIKNRASM